MDRVSFWTHGKEAQEALRVIEVAPNAGTPNRWIVFMHAGSSVFLCRVRSGTREAHVTACRNRIE